MFDRVLFTLLDASLSPGLKPVLAMVIFNRVFDDEEALKSTPPRLLIAVMSDSVLFEDCLTKTPRLVLLAATTSVRPVLSDRSILIP